VSGILNAQGHLLMPMSLLQAWQEQLLPLATLLIIKVNEAELLLDTIISSDQEMIEVASRLRALGAGAVLLRGGRQTEGLLTALLADENGYRFFTSRNLDGWQRHGVGGALSSAIATRLAFGDSLQQAVTEAHTYMHSQVVYAVSATGDALRPADLYNRLMTFIADYHTKAHDVAFYANKLAITPRYLAQITARVVDKSPKQVIYDYLLQEALALLANTRLTIQEIAYRLGFSSQAMFTRFFNQQQGCSPSQYRLDL
jgi:hydroxymethylpyrimidine/phosphomethylpyrimidine kinase